MDGSAPNRSTPQGHGVRAEPPRQRAVDREHAAAADDEGTSWCRRAWGRPAPSIARSREAGHAREVSVRVSHFLNVPPLVARTDLVAAPSRRVAAPFARMLSLQLFELPVRLRASRVGMVWHDSLRDDPVHRWLREVLAGGCARV